jgi:opacity protein-like surface antigen
MKTFIAAALVALAAITSSSMAAETVAANESAKAGTATVYHAGGKHDQRQHEAALRARANGQKLERIAIHAGGRHDARGHEAASRADEKRDGAPASR